MTALVVKPGNIATVTATPAAGKITVTWTAADNAAIYEISRKYGGKWTTVEDAFVGTTYVDTDVVGGSEYQYSIRAKNAAGNSSWKYSAAVTALTNAKPGAIATITATPAAGKITVTWAASEGAETYEISRKYDGVWTTVESAYVGTTYVDTDVVGGSSYQYSIRGKNAVGSSAWAYSAAAEAL